MRSTRCAAAPDGSAVEAFMDLLSITRRGPRWLLAGLALLAFNLPALADPPGRVARLAYMSGPVSFAPAGEDAWDEATINRPLTPGDRLWVDQGARAELQLGGTALRLGDATAVSLLNLDDQIAQVQLTEGRLNVRVRRLEPDQLVEVDTPHLAFTLRQPGVYRIEVDSEGQATTIRMREGEGEATGEGGSYLVQAPQVQRFTGDAVLDEGYADNAPPPDDFDRWALERDRRVQASPSARYVSPDVIGYEDLDDEGSWSVEASYGNVWYPRRVAVDWAPYRQGHWAWVDPWGWTWVDDAPWGFAVSHYGRWAHIRGRWGWIPGPVRTRAYYAPALVAFVGGPNFSLSVSIGGGGGGGGGVAWFPLGPREVYRPAYRVSPRYFEQVNVSNTVVNKTVINNVYINKVTNVTYVNRRVPGAVVAVPRTAFAESQPVAKVVVKVPREVVEGREVAETAPIPPVEKSVHGSAPPGRRPPAQAFTRQVVAKTPPPPAKVSFAAQRERLAQQPGKPLDDEERKELRARLPAAGPAASAAAAPAVKVVAASASAPRALRPRAGASGAAAANEPQAASAPRQRASEPDQGPRSTAAPRERGEGASAPRRRAEAASAAATPASAAERRRLRNAAPADGAASGTTTRPPRAASAPERGSSTAAERRAARAAAASRAAPPASAPEAPVRRRPAPAAADGEPRVPPANVDERRAAREAREARAAERAQRNAGRASAPEPGERASEARRKRSPEESR
jgi:hypothetical protein